MYIKSSGYSLSEVSLDNGYTILDNEKLKNFLIRVKNKSIDSNIERKSISILKNSVLLGASPSIESYSHTLLKKFTILIQQIPRKIIFVILFTSGQKQILNLNAVSLLFH